VAQQWSEPQLDLAVDYATGRLPCEIVREARELLEQELMAEGARRRQAMLRSRDVMLESQLVIQL
jgi:hypothetical protein